MWHKMYTCKVTSIFQHLQRCRTSERASEVGGEGERERGREGEREGERERGREGERERGR